MPENTKFDINDYAIKLELSLSTQAAKQGLDDLEDQLTKLEQQVSSAAKAALAEFQTTATDITTQVIELNKQYTDIFALIEQTPEQLLKIQEFYDKEQRFVTDRYDKLKDTRDIYDIFIQRHTTIGQAIITETALLNTEQEAFRKILEQVDKKNAEHLREKGIIEEEIIAVEKLQKGMAAAGYTAGQSANAFGHILSTVRQIVHWVNILVNKELEEFHTANYRTIADMNAIVAEVTSVSVATGLLRETVMETYKEMGNMRYPRLELEKYARIIGETNRVTGVGVKQIAAYVQNLRAAGFNAAQSEGSLNTLIESMRKLGLSTSDIDHIMKSTTVDAAELAIMYGDKNAITKLNQTQAIWMGIAKGAHASVDQVTGVSDALGQMAVDLETNAAMASLLGHAIDKNMDTMGETYAEAAVKISELMAAKAKTGALYSEYAGAYAKLYTKGNIEALRGLRLVGDQLRASGDVKQAYIKQRDTALQAAAAAATMDEAYQEANKNAYWILQQTANQFLNIGRELQFYFEVPLAAIIGLFGVLAFAISWPLQKLHQLVTWLDTLVPAVGGFKHAVSALIGTLMLGALAWTGWLQALARLALKFQPVQAIVTQARAMVTGFFDTLTDVISGIGRMFEAVGTAIGNTLRNIFQPLAELAGPMLATGAAILMIGGGMWLMAQGAVAMAREGWAAVGMLVALGVTVVAFVAIMAWLAPTSAAAAAGLIPLGIAILGIGAAVALVGVGIRLILDGIAGVATAFSSFFVALTTSSQGMQFFIDHAKDLGKALWDLVAAVGVTGAIGLAALGASMKLLGWGAQSLGEGLERTLAALRDFGANAQTFLDNIQKLGAALQRLGSSGIDSLAAGLTRLSESLRRLTVGDQLQPLTAALTALASATQRVGEVMPAFVAAIDTLGASLRQLDMGTAVGLLAIAAALQVFTEADFGIIGGRVRQLGESFELLAAHANAVLAHNIQEIADSLLDLTRGMGTMNSKLLLVMRGSSKLEGQARTLHRSMGGIRQETTALAGSGPKFAATGGHMDKLADTMGHLIEKLQDRKIAGASKTWGTWLTDGMQEALTNTGKMIQNLKNKFSGIPPWMLFALAPAVAVGGAAVGRGFSQLLQEVDISKALGETWTGIQIQAGKFLIWMKVDLPKGILAAGTAVGQKFSEFLIWMKVDLPKGILAAGTAVGQQFSGLWRQMDISKALGETWAGIKIQASEFLVWLEVDVPKGILAAGAAVSTAVSGWTSSLSDSITSGLAGAGNAISSLWSQMTQLVGWQTDEAARSRARAAATKTEADFREQAVAREARALRLRSEEAQRTNAAIARLDKSDYERLNNLQRGPALIQRQTEATASHIAKMDAATASIYRFVDAAAHRDIAGDKLRETAKVLGGAYVQLQNQMATTPAKLIDPQRTMIDGVTAIYDEAARQVERSQDRIFASGERLVTQLDRKVIPALQKSQDKVHDNLRAESLATVQVTHTREAARNTDHQAELNRFVSGLHSFITGQKAKPLEDIIALLETHLPGMAKPDAGTGHALTSSINNWMA